LLKYNLKEIQMNFLIFILIIIIAIAGTIAERSIPCNARYLFGVVICFVCQILSHFL